MKIAHLTSVHARYDTRIFVKQCRSLAANGYEVFLIVADGRGDEQKDGVEIRDAGSSSSRLHRILKSTRRVTRSAIAIDADIFHLHDPELIPAGLRLKRMGKRVIFDAHEDAAKQMLSKNYLGPVSKKLLAGVFSRFEKFSCGMFDGIITATPPIRDKFLPINPRSVDINNFPLLDELHAGVPWDDKKAEVCYVGTISALRGIRELIKAMGEVTSSARLNLAGSFSGVGLEEDVKAMPGWSKTNNFGFIDRDDMRKVLSRSVAGLVTLHPEPNHMDAQPNKMFEYMSAGIPVIASDFARWREVIDEKDCGLCVDPLDSLAIARAIDELIINPDKAQRMGENGRSAVESQYNWPAEEKKLLSFYSSISQSLAG